MGASTVLFVNLRERAVVESAYQLYRAQADYAVARGGMLWAKGALSKPWPTESLAKYGDPLTSAGLNGYKQTGPRLIRYKEHPSMAALLLVILILLPVTTLAEPVHDSSALSAVRPHRAPDHQRSARSY